MSTIKHLVLTERTGTFIEIISVDGRPEIVVADAGKPRMAYFEPEDGAKTALAILEAVGYTDSATGKNGYLTAGSAAIRHLQSEIEDQAKATAEAKVREQLDVEALGFLNAVREDAGKPTVATWDGFTGETRMAYFAVAKKARELAKEAGE